VLGKEVRCRAHVAQVEGPRIGIDEALTGTFNLNTFGGAGCLAHVGLHYGLSKVSAASGGRPRIKSLAFSAIMTTAALVLPPMMDGNTEASAMRRLSRPTTRSACSTTAAASLPMRQVLTG